MKYIECPKKYLVKFPNPHLTLFLGGGITNCPPWQDEMVELLKDTDLVLLNPRREKFDITDPTLEKEQIRWEFRHMNLARAIMFWFPMETLCPIALYELGSWINFPKKLFVGHHPEYQRRRDLRIQIPLARKGQKIHESLAGLAKEIKKWAVTTRQEMDRHREYDY